MKRIVQQEQPNACKLIAAVENTSAYAPAYLRLDISPRLIDKIAAAKNFIEAHEGIERVGISSLGDWDGLGTGTGSITHIDTDGMSIVIHGVESVRQERFHTEMVAIEQLIESARNNEDLITPAAEGYTLYMQDDSRMEFS